MQHAAATPHSFPSQAEKSLRALAPFRSLVRRPFWNQLRNYLPHLSRLMLAFENNYDIGKQGF